MKQKLTFLLLLFACLSSIAGNKEYEVFGPQGGLSMVVTLPKGFDTQTGKCPMVILMHGIFSSKDYNPMPYIAKELSEEGISSIRFDFNGHGRSEGRMQDMTVEKEIADAMAIWNYARSLPYVTDIGFLGHSQGGVIASMTAGLLASEGGEKPKGMVLIAPGSVIKEACQGGKFFNARFDPSSPPEFIRCWGIMKLGREYLIDTQKLDIYGTAAGYDNPVCILHGTKFVETYGDRSKLTMIEGENHMITQRRKETVAHCIAFFKELFER